MWGSSGRLGRRLAAAVPAMLLGMAAGFVGGAWAAGSMDTTPYDQTDLNTASRVAQQTGSTEGWNKAKQAADRAAARLRSLHEDQVGLLKANVAAVRKAQKQAEKKVEEQQAKLTRLQSSLAETTAALNNATTSGGPKQGRSVEGTLRSTWVLGGKDMPWPQDCAEPLQSYQVRVTAGADATVATARLVDAEVVRRTPQPDQDPKKGKPQAPRKTPKKVTGVLVCSMTYTASLPTPLGGGYKFVVVGSDKAETRLETAAASGTALGDGTAPTLSVTRRAG
jgi:hypothetical protein